MNAEIISVRKKDDKSSLVILSLFLDGQRQKYTISEGTYREIGCPLSGSLLNEYELEVIVKKDEERRCMIKALNILAYADNNERNLTLKLLRAGFSKDNVLDTVKECTRLGYINEERQAERLIIRCAEQLFGPRKIISKLVSRGYSPSLSKRLISSLELKGEIDFSEQKKLLLEKKLSDGSDPEEKKKLLYRYGY